MASLNGTQLDYLRNKHPHAKRTYASPIPIVPLWSGTINDSNIGLGATTITFSGGTGQRSDASTDFAVLQPEMLVLVGSTVGDDSYGFTRLKGTDGGGGVTGEFYVGLNSDVNWTDGATVTVIGNMFIMPKFPSFTLYPETFYKDGQAYTDENVNTPPVVIMGSDWAGWADGSGEATITLHADNSYTMATGATKSSVLWEAIPLTHLGGYSIAAPTSFQTTITLDTAGVYLVKCTVVDSNTKSSVGYRYFIMHDDSFPPFLIQQASRVWDFDTGGASFDFAVYGNADETIVPDRTKIIIWSENYYRGTNVDISFLNSGELADRLHIDFIGYVTAVSTGINPNDPQQTGFTANTAEAILVKKFEYPVPIIADPSATNGTIDDWWKFPTNKLTVAAALFHLWKWHSNLLELVDAYLPISNTITRAGTENFTQGDLYSKARSFCDEEGIFYRPVFNIFNQFIINEKNINFLDQATRAAQTVLFTLTGLDWKDTVEPDINIHKNIAVANVSGGYWNGAEFTALLSKFGQYAGSDGVGALKVDNILATTQEELNFICGRLVAIENSEIVRLTVTLAGNWSSAVGVMPQHWVLVNLTVNDKQNNRQIVLTNARFVPRTVSTTFNEELSVSETTVELVPEVFGRNGIPGDYPTGFPDQEVNDEPNSEPSWVGWTDDDGSGSYSGALDYDACTYPPGIVDTEEYLTTETAYKGAQSDKCIVMVTDEYGVIIQAKAASIVARGIQINSNQTLTLGAETSIEGSVVTNLSARRISDTRTMVVYSIAGSLKARIIENAGTTLTVGAAFTIISETVVDFDLALLDTLRAAIFYQIGPAENYIVVANFSSSTISGLGTPLNLTDLTFNTGGNKPRLVAMTDALVVLNYLQTGQARAMSITVSDDEWHEPSQIKTISSLNHTLDTYSRNAVVRINNTNYVVGYIADLDSGYKCSLMLVQLIGAELKVLSNISFSSGGEINDLAMYKYENSLVELFFRNQDGDLYLNSFTVQPDIGLALGGSELAILEPASAVDETYNISVACNTKSQALVLYCDPDDSNKGKVSLVGCKTYQQSISTQATRSTGDHNLCVKADENNLFFLTDNFGGEYYYFDISDGATIQQIPTPPNALAVSNLFPSMAAPQNPGVYEGTEWVFVDINAGEPVLRALTLDPANHTASAGAVSAGLKTHTDSYNHGGTTNIIANVATGYNRGIAVVKCTDLDSIVEDPPGVFKSTLYYLAVGWTRSGTTVTLGAITKLLEQDIWTPDDDQVYPVDEIINCVDAGGGDVLWSWLRQPEAGVTESRWFRGTASSAGTFESATPYSDGLGVDMYLSSNKYTIVMPSGSVIVSYSAIDEVIDSNGLLWFVSQGGSANGPVLGLPYPPNNLTTYRVAKFPLSTNRFLIGMNQDDGTGRKVYLGEMSVKNNGIETEFHLDRFQGPLGLPGASIYDGGRFGGGVHSMQNGAAALLVWQDNDGSSTVKVTYFKNIKKV